MYNLTVNTAHSYFVGAGQWLVDNCGGTGIPNDVDKLGEVVRRFDTAKNIKVANNEGITFDPTLGEDPDIPSISSVARWVNIFDLLPIMTPFH